MNGRHGGVPRGASESAIRRGIDAVMSSAARTPSRRAGSGAPNTTLRMMSRVRDWKRGSVRSGRPGIQRATSASASAAIVARCASMRSPWNGGSMSLRWRMCGAPSSRRMELGPANGSMMAELAPPCSCSGGAA